MRAKSPRSGALSVAALLAPEAELFLHRAIRIAEQHGLVVGMVAYRHPARYDKDVVRPPAEDLFTDPGLTLALDHDINRAGGRSECRARRARPSAPASRCRGRARSMRA